MCSGETDVESSRTYKIQGPVSSATAKSEVLASRNDPAAFEILDAWFSLPNEDAFIAQYKSQPFWSQSAGDALLQADVGGAYHAALAPLPSVTLYAVAFYNRRRN